MELKTLLDNLKKNFEYKWKIQSVPKVKDWEEKKGNCVAYMDARDCMDILDLYCEEWWQNEFYEVKWKVFCKVWIRINWEWFWKSDSWALESSENVEEETTSKGETSDAFKRACVQWWIGRFLYEKEIIWISQEEYKANRFKINEFCKSREKNWSKNTDTIKTTLQTKKEWVLHSCTKCWKESIANIFKWQYGECYKCEHCNWYSKPNLVKTNIDWATDLYDIPF